jgi:hypothetical protein
VFRERGTALTHNDHIITGADVDIFPAAIRERRSQTDRVELEPERKLNSEALGEG